MEIKDAQVENYDEILFRMNRYLQCNFMTGGQGQMNIMIASDIHGSAYYCSKLMEAFEREGADRLLLLGDLLYHGPRNDLPRDYAPKEVLRMLNGRKQKIFCVRGNCDTEVDQMVLEFPILADYAILEAGNSFNLCNPRPRVPPAAPANAAARRFVTAWSYSYTGMEKIWRKQFVCKSWFCFYSQRGKSAQLHDAYR